MFLGNKQENRPQGAVLMFGGAGVYVPLKQLKASLAEMAIE